MSTFQLILRGQYCLNIETTKIQKKKLKTNVPINLDEKYFQQNINKSNLT